MGRIKWLGLGLALCVTPAQAQTPFSMPPPAGVVVLGVQVVTTCGAVSLGTTQPAYVAMNAQGQLCTNAGGGSIVVSNFPVISNPIVPADNFTRLNNTTAYALGQLVANSATAGSVVPLSWTTPASTFRIVRVRMSLSGKSVTNTNFRIHFFNASPGVANGDGGTFTPSLLADEVCEMDVTVALAGSDVSMGYGAANQGAACYVALASGTTLFGLVEARAAYTPTAQEVVTVIPELD